MTGISAPPPSCAEARSAAGGGGRKATVKRRVRAKLSDLLTRRLRASERIIAIYSLGHLGGRGTACAKCGRRGRHTRRAGCEGRRPIFGAAGAGRPFSSSELRPRSTTAALTPRHCLYVFREL